MPRDAEDGDERSWRLFERDYFALLGVSRDASSEEIRSRYLALSREFHPDRRRKAQNAEIITLANTQYPLLDRAYKVLSDPVKRRVYTIYGEKGVLALEQDTELQTAVGAHLKSSEEIQRHVEDVLRRLNQQTLEGQFSSFSEMSMHVDASDFVCEPMRGLRSLLQPGGRYVERTEMTIHQRTVFPLSRQTKLTLGGYMYDKNGLGMGSFTAQLAYASTDPNVPSVSLSSELGWTPKLQCQISQPVSTRTVFILVPELDDHGLDFSVGANQLLTSHLHGAMMWSTREGLSASLTNDNTQGMHAAAAVAVGRRGPNMSLQIRRAFVASATALKLSLRAGLATGVSLAIGGSRDVSRRSRVVLGVLLAKAGVTLRVGFTRGNVRFVMPIFLSPFSAQSAFSTFCMATTPFLVAAVVDQLVKPAQERRRRRDREHTRARRVQYLRNAQQSALAQQKLMERYAQEKREQEQQRKDGKGLVIILARYGRNPTNPDAIDRAESERMQNNAHLESDENDDAVGASEENQAAVLSNTAFLEQKWVDVTIPLQFFVQDSSLSLHGSSKAGLLGFYNPCISEEQTVEDAPLATHTKPQLYVRYAYDGNVFEATFDDEQVVQLPSRYAQMMGPLGRVY